LRNFAILAFAAGALALSGCKPSEEKKPEAQTSGQPIPQGDGFDFYVLSLSWSPSYCEAEGESANRQQCTSKRPYAFVVHGLWPQFERGYPENCDIRERDVDQQTLRGLYDIMPSAGLIRHQWRKHGSCAGLSQSDYFDVLRAARERIEIPAAFQNPTKYETVSPDSDRKGVSGSQ
jgi:ribonuclease T2